jgi:SAM-dependent methyltransferase
MTGFEIAYRWAQPFLPPLYSSVRRRLISFARESGHQQPDILDVGGRKSHYTIGVPARIVISELPRQSSLQGKLNLGLTDQMIAATLARRTNIAAIEFDDMAQSKIEDDSFDCVVAVEVLEHVERDAEFLRNVYRVLRPGGMFLMTTPNGDSVPVPHNPDHKRHYPRKALQRLLEDIFNSVEIEYAIVAGRARTMGLGSWSARNPLRTFASMAGNIVNSMQSARPRVREQRLGTRHLIATSYKAS